MPGGGMPGPHGQMAAPQYQSQPDRPQYQSHPDRPVPGMMQMQGRPGSGTGQYASSGSAGGMPPAAQPQQFGPQQYGHQGMMSLPPRADWTPPFSQQQQQGGMHSLPQAGPQPPRQLAPAADESDPSRAGVGLFFQQTIHNHDRVYVKNLIRGGSADREGTVRINDVRSPHTLLRNWIWRSVLQAGSVFRAGEGTQQACRADTSHMKRPSIHNFLALKSITRCFGYCLHRSCCVISF